MKNTTMAIIMLFIAGLLLIGASVSLYSNAQSKDSTIYSIEDIWKHSYIDQYTIIRHVEGDGSYTYNLTLG